MQSDPEATSRNLRVSTEGLSDLQRVNRHGKPDTRRFASIFPLEPPGILSSNVTHEEHDDNGHDPSRSRPVSTLDDSTPTAQAQVPSVASVDGHLTLSEAQQIISCYHAIHGCGHAPECVWTEINEGLSQVPDDQNSMHTISTSVEAQPTMDMMWRPKPKVYIHPTDQKALIQAQIEAIGMMHSAGLKPTSKIPCRHHGCTDVLPGVKALKYHIHIHNIADAAVEDNDASSSTVYGSSPIERSTSNYEMSKRSHSRSKSTLGIQLKRSTTYFSPRKLSVSGLLPLHIPPRESTPEAQNSPSLKSVTKPCVSNLIPSSSADTIPARDNDGTSFTNAWTPLRGRKTRKESMTVPVGTDRPSITMVLSQPSSPETRGRPVLTPHLVSPISLTLGPGMDGENDNCVVAPSESSHKVPGMLSGPHSPMRALSPTRAMSPIRNGIKRFLSSGCAADPSV